MLAHNGKQQRKSQGGKGNVSRLLISINVMGSPGPIRFVVREDELVGSVIDTALRSYARQGRLPVLGSDPGDFLLYRANAESDGKTHISFFTPISVFNVHCPFFLFYLKVLSAGEVKFCNTNSMNLRLNIYSFNNRYYTLETKKKKNSTRVDKA